jgi:hypothetical protein
LLPFNAVRGVLHPNQQILLNHRVYALQRKSHMLMKKKVGPWVGVSLALALSVALMAEKPGGKSFPPKQAAAVVQGLQLVISAPEQGKPGQPELQVEFRNVGEHDMSLNLGMMLGNGRSQFPTNVLLSLTDAEGTERELKFKEPPVAGRIDDYIVPLRAGSTYSLKLNVNQFWVPQSKEFDVKLNAGKNQITAHFEGTEASHTESLKLVHMGIWRGKIESNLLTIDDESKP